MWFDFLIALFLGVESGLLIGLINPKWIGSKKRYYVLVLMVIFLIIFFIVGVFFNKSEHQPNEVEALIILTLWIGLAYLIIKKKIFLDVFQNIDTEKSNLIKEEQKKEDSSPTLDTEVVYTKSNNKTKIQEFNKHLLITYRDAKGTKTQREINILTSNTNNIYAYCHLRNQDRSFKVSNIVECIDADTGEVIYDISNYFKGNKSPNVTKIESEVELNDRDKFKIPRYSTKKSDFLHIKDTTDYSGIREDIETQKDYDFLAQNLLEFNINHEDELFEAIDKKFLKKHQEDLMFNDKEIDYLGKKSDFHKNIFLELYADYIDGLDFPLDVLEKDIEILRSLIFIDEQELSVEDRHKKLMSYKKDELVNFIEKNSSIEPKGLKKDLCNIIIENDLKVGKQSKLMLNRDSFEPILNMTSNLIIEEIENLIEDWHIIAKYEVYHMIYSDYENLQKKIDKKVKFYESMVDDLS